MNLPSVTGRELAWLALLLALRPGAGAADPLTPAEIRALPPSFAAEFRDPDRYDWSTGAPIAADSNCASLALNEWGNQSLAGTTTKEDVATLMSEAGRMKPLCPAIEQLMRTNRGIRVTAPEKGTCAAGSWMVVPMHVRFDLAALLQGRDIVGFHLVRQVPELGNRFVQIGGPGQPLEWFTIGGRVATRFDQMRSIPGYKVCSPVCVTDAPLPDLTPPGTGKVPVRAMGTDPARLAGTWLGVEPAAEPDVPWRGYRSPRCDAYLNRMELHLGANAAQFLSTAVPRGASPATLAALSIVSNVLDPERRRTVGVNLVWSGRVDANAGRIEFPEVAYFGGGADAAAQTGSAMFGPFLPWIVQPRPGSRISITSVGENSLRATIDWDSSCPREILFVRPQVAYSGAAAR